MKTRTQNSVRNIIFGLGSQGIEVLLKFVGRTVFIYCLSAVYLGVNGLFSEILTMLSLAELGVGSAIVYAMYKPLQENDEEKIAALMALYGKAYIAIGIFVAVLGSALIPFLKYIIKDAGELKSQITNIYLFYLFNTAISYFFSYKSSLLIADQKNYIVQTVKEFCAIGRTIFQCIVLLVYRNFYLYLLVESIFIVANNVWVSIYVDQKYKYLKEKRNSTGLDFATKNSLWVNIRALVLVKISTILVNSTDNTIITIFGGIVEVGLYSNYSMFITMFTTVLNQIFSNISASVGNLNAEGDREKSKLVFDAIHMTNFWLFSWIAIGYAILINPIISVWIGNTYLLPKSIVYIIAVNFYIKGMQNAVWVFKDTYGLFKYGKYMTFGTALLNLFLSVVWGKRFGLIGILGATAVSRIMTNVWYDPYALFKHGFGKSVFSYYCEYGFYGSLSIIAYGVTYWFCTKVPFEGIASVGAQFVIACITPNLIYFVVLGRTQGFAFLKEKINHIFMGIRKRKRER